MKTLARLAPALTLALLIVPAVASAAISTSIDSAGNFTFGYNSAGQFACGASNICQVANTLLYIINNVLVPLIFAASFIIFLYGVAKSYIWSQGGDDVKKGHTLILWGLVGFAVMISVWGLVNVVANTFGLSGYVAPPTPAYTPVPGGSGTTVIFHN